MASRFAIRWLIYMLVALSVSLAVAASARAAISASPDLTGTWTVVNTSGPGAPGTLVITNGSGGEFNGTGYGSYLVKGTVSGSSIQYTVSDSSYTATFTGTVNSDGTRITYSWTDSNHRSGTAYLERQVSQAPAAPSTTPPPETLCGGADCSGLQLAVTATLPAGETMASLDYGCSAVRTTAAVQAASVALCDLGSIPTDPNDPMVKAWNEMLRSPSGGFGGPDFEQFYNELFDRLGAPSPAVVNDATQALHELQHLPAPQQTPILQTDDGLLETAFPPDSARVPAAAYQGLPLGASAAPAPSAVIESIYARAPSRAQALAFAAAITLATSKTYSPARAIARLTLSIAALIGSRELGHETAAAKQIVLGTVHLKLPARTRRTISIKASTLGGRILRLLAVDGLAHRTTVRVQLTTSNPTGTTSSHKQVTIR